MATKKYGLRATEWWRHLRRYGKRAFWRKLRRMIRRELREETR